MVLGMKCLEVRLSDAVPGIGSGYGKMATFFDISSTTLLSGRAV